MEQCWLVWDICVRNVAFRIHAYFSSTQLHVDYFCVIIILVVWALLKRTGMIWKLLAAYSRWGTFPTPTQTWIMILLSFLLSCYYNFLIVWWAIQYNLQTVKTWWWPHHFCDYANFVVISRLTCRGQRTLMWIFVFLFNLAELWAQKFAFTSSRLRSQRWLLGKGEPESFILHPLS